MKKFTSTLITLLLCLYVTAQVGVLETTTFNNPDGFVVNAIDAADDYGQAMSMYNDGRIVVAVYNTDKWFTLARYMPNGTPDNSFGINGIVKVRNTNDDAIAYAVQVLSDNTILVAGTAWNPANSSFDMALVKLDVAGDPIPGFGGQGNGWVLTPIGSVADEAHSIVVQADGKIVIAGFGNMGAAGNDFAVVRYSSNGVLETGGAFGAGTGIVTTDISGADDEALSVGIQADQKIVVGGTSNDGAANSNFAVVRYNTDGTLDATPGNFGAGGIADIDLGNGGAGSTDLGYKLILQPDGKILMTGMSKAVSSTNTDMGTIRLTTAGALDALFNPTGAIVNRTGGFTAAGVAIFNNHPVSNTDEGARTIALQSNGKFLVGGDSDGSTSSFAFLLLRYNSDGTLDNTFDGTSNGNGVIAYDFSGLPDYGYDIALYGNRIYFTGSTGNNFTRDFLLAAIQNDGAPLPIVLSQFYAQKQTSKVILQWQTSSEENVKQFVIERSNDGKTYKAIGTVAAAGNSAITQKYSFADGSPFMSNNNYYRLLMQDIDGNYKYSKILIIKFDGALSTNVQVFPSNVRDLLQVQLPTGLKGNVSLQIIDMSGRVVKKNSLASDGNALFTTMDVSTLVNGVYVLKAQVGKTMLTTRFTKQ